MLIGTYEHNIDGKNRLFVPAKFRLALGNEFIYKVCRSKFPSIQLYSRAQFEREIEKALEGVKEEVLRRRILASKYLGTGEATCDSQGRIVISSSLAKMAKLDKECILSGFGEYVEIMSPEVYEQYNASLFETVTLEEDSYYKQEELRCQKRSEGAYLDINQGEE